EAPRGTAPVGAVELDRWWLAFHDDQLTTLIEQALVANPDARIAAARLAEARALRTEALVQFLPQGDVRGATNQTDTHQLSGLAFNFPGFSSSGVSNASA